MKPNVNKKKLPLLFLPLLAVPITLIAISLSAKHCGQQESEPSGKSAFNSKVPAANQQPQPKNKLEAYLAAQADSVKKSQALAGDPYAATDPVVIDPLPDQHMTYPRIAPARPGSQDREQQMEQRLADLYKALQPSPADSGGSVPPPIPARTEAEAPTAQLEQMMQMLQQQSGDDPEMAQLKSVLESALDLQYPQRVKNWLSAQASAARPKPVAVRLSPMDTDSSEQRPVTALAPAGNRFYPVTYSMTTATDPAATFVAAVIHDNQSVLERATVKLRTLQDIFIGADRIPRNSFIFGKATPQADRLMIEVTTVNFNQVIYPVKVTLFDGVDGMEGVRIERTIGNESSKESMTDAVSQLQLASLDPSIGQQAANTGLQAIRGLMNKKIKRKPVALKAGHQLLLKFEQP
ncbi:conjugative transposon protein TraM [Chitinophaga lutea]|nr:conjugative transposon protein TraM [Chitinophaga lutea]